MERLEMIERYVEGQMQGTELTTFLHELESDATLRQEMEEYKTLIGGINLYGQQSFINQVSNWEKEIRQKEQTQGNANFQVKAATETKTGSSPSEKSATKVISFQSQWVKYVAAAACVVLIAVFGYNFLGNKELASGAELYASSYEPYNAQNTRDAQYSDLSEVQKAISAYDSKRYAEAITQFETLEKTMSDSAQIHLYHGLSALEMNQLDVAKQQLSIAAKSNNDTYSDVADWYLIMIMLKENKVEEAKSALTQLSKDQEGHAYKVKAANLLKKM